MKASQFLAVLLAGTALIAGRAGADIAFRHAVTGETLNFEYGKPGGDTDAFKKFKETGKNPYNGDKTAIEKGHSLYLSACSGCHGHEAEGKLGPGLADDYWTYPRGATDVGLFEILWGGAQGMMGPQNTNLNADEMLRIMAWLRSIYKGDPAKAEWLK
ncbi:cytochrome c(L), periplasmic [Candidatus Methylocalor cossyra]|uniref:Cytochrome c-L (Cytochrome c551I) (Cytochrome c552) n=1 Tax=Candidatus Methylocalor cossyra TaxID=3108543 RepID=A0ABM9NDZ0_9GAMM